MISDVTPIYASIEAHAQSAPDKMAVVETDGSMTLTYAALRDQVARIATGLSAKGVKASDLVALESDHATKHLVSAAAVMAIGAIPFPLPPRFPDARRKIMGYAEPRCRVYFDEDPADGGAAISFDALAQSGTSDFVLDRPADPEDLAMIYFTSGTTSGEPKGVMQPHRELESTARNIVDIMQLDDSVTELPATRMETGFWFGRCRVVMRVGGRLVLHSGDFNPLRVAGILSKYHCNAMTGDSPLFLAMVEHLGTRLERLAAQMRWTKIASQILNPEIKRRLIELWPTTRIVMNYGLMEAMRVSIIVIRENQDRLESVGRPCPGVEVRISAPDLHDVPVGEIGEIRVKGPNVALGYYKKEELWAEKYRNGWYATGDIGYLDGDGFLFVLGRKDDALNVGGRTIMPIEIEDHLRNYIADTDFVISGAPDPQGILGDVPALCVRGGWKESKPIRRFLSELSDRFPASHIPKVYLDIDEYPSTPNGKLRRVALRENIALGQYPTLDT